MSSMSPFLEQLIFGTEAPLGYKREFETRGVWYKRISSGRWELVRYPTSDIEPCGGCGWFYPPARLYSCTVPQTRNPANWIEGIDYGDGSYRHVCRGCANRFDALHKRYELYHEIGRLTRRLQAEIANARRQASAA